MAGSGPLVVLVGLPGTGKSTVGRRLAARLGCAFADSDVLIERAAGRTIPEIFAVDGEAAFRRLESDVIDNALRTFAGVLALGGGAVTSTVVRAALKAAAVPVAWLTAEHPAMLTRIG